MALSARPLLLFTKKIIEIRNWLGFYGIIVNIYKISNLIAILFSSKIVFCTFLAFRLTPVPLLYWNQA